MVHLVTIGITDVDTYRDCLRTLHSQAVIEAKTNFVSEALQLHHPISHLLKVCCLSQSIPPLPSCVLVTVRCLSGVWSGTTLRTASVQLSKTSDATYSARPVGQPDAVAYFLNLDN